MTKIQGETFTLVKETQKIVKMTNSEINNKYKRGEIRIVTEQARYPIKSIPGMLESGDYNLNPEYQRRKRWSNTRKSRLIESFIMNVPLPPIFLYEYEYSKYEVMDGLQRLSSINDFYKGVFELEGLEYWKELNGMKYLELPEEVQRGIDRRYISSIVLLEETAKSLEEAAQLKQIVFERLNSGGEKLNQQETRNALYNGRFNELCLKLSANEKFREMWNIPLDHEGDETLSASETYRRMDDVELVLRFFSYRFIDEMSGTIENFLDQYLKQANDFSDETILKLEKLFNETIDIVYGLFGKEAFISPKYEREVKKPQKTIYDPLMQSIAKIVNYKIKIIEHKDDINDKRYEGKVRPDGSKLFDGRDSVTNTVVERIKYFDDFFKEYLE